jgi:hypothetical protein
MAILKPGAIIGAISGTVGGVTFKNGRGPIVLAHRQRIPATSTRLQINSQARFLRACNAWRAMTTLQRAGWAIAARTYPHSNRLGLTVYMSGFQFFVHTNTIPLFLRTNLTTTPYPPSAFTPPTAIVTSFYITENSAIDTIPLSNPNYFFAHCHVSRSLRTTRGGPYCRFLYFGTFTMSTGSVDCTANVAASFPSPRQGEYYKLSTQIWDSTLHYHGTAFTEGYMNP